MITKLLSQQCQLEKPSTAPNWRTLDAQPGKCLQEQSFVLKGRMKGTRFSYATCLQPAPEPASSDPLAAAWGKLSKPPKMEPIDLTQVFGSP